MGVDLWGFGGVKVVEWWLEGRCRVEREKRWEEREKYLVINEDKSLGFNFLYSLNT